MSENKPKELSMDELKNVVNQLQQQNKFLIEQFKKHNEESFYKRMDYLFKVLENKSLFDEKFAFNCSMEIQETLTIPEEIKQSENNIVE